MPTADKIRELVLGLPELYQLEVLRFIETLLIKARSDNFEEVQPYALDYVEFGDSLWFEFAVSQAMKKLPSSQS